jgi:DNA gyrase subunit A
LGRGAQGNDAGGNKDDDTVAKLFVAQTHDTLLCFSDRGKVYALRVYRLPRTSRAARGRPINNLLPLEGGENITALLPVRDFEVEGLCVFMATAQGTVKKTALSAFGNVRSSGIRAVTLDEGDRLVGVDVTTGGNEVMLLSSGGKAIRFHEEDVRAMGRDASGVRGITLADGQEVISLIVVRDGMVLTLSENGYGKRTAIDEFPTKGRGGQGVIALQLSERNGKMVAAVQVADRDQLVIISREGRLLRTRVGTISVVGRNTQGVKVMRLKDEDRVLEVARVAYMEGMEQEAVTTEPDLLPEPGTDVPAPDAGLQEGSGAEAE